MNEDPDRDLEREHLRLRPTLGAFLLDGLSAEEADAVSTHLDRCDRCRAELSELRPAASALDDLRDAVVDLGAPENPPADLGTKVLRAVAVERRRQAAESRRRSWLRAAALSAIGGTAAAVALVVGLAVTGPDPAPVVPLEAVAVDVSATGVVADADLVNHTWGVEVKLQGSGFESGARYEVVVLGTDGVAHPAGEFVGVGSKDMLCNLNSSVLRAEAAGFEVRDANGDVVLASTFTRV